MIKTRITIDRRTFPLLSLNTLVVGSGAAGLAAAAELHRLGQTNVAIATEAWGAGASNNSGSDKQTYYKLSLAPESADSVRLMAEDLAAGGSMHGDVALAEAAGSLPAFFNLVRLGVPFPHDRFGAYPGYKTDHDPRGRATSAGPLTSHLMFERLAAEVTARRIPVLDRTPIVGLIVADRHGARTCLGAIGLERRTGRGRRPGFILFNAVNVILATGGPGGLYRSSVYPESQTGSHGLAFEAGAAGQNLTESQFGLASLKFRWNLSGSYQQAIPRYFSTAPDGSDEREFLGPFFPDTGRLATAVFLKGYQWPFDPRKVEGSGSSLIDLLVHRERAVLGRKVFLDYRRDAAGGGKKGPFDLKRLSSEAFTYLESRGALLDRPIARLERLNPPALELYRSHGIDLASEPLEVAVCGQHNNGGLRGDLWWQTTVRHLFAAGEVMGTHGVYRPGGSALNAGQVGAHRAALLISRRFGDKPPKPAAFRLEAAGQVRARLEWAEACRRSGTASGREALEEIRERMDACGAIIRRPGAVREELPKAWRLYRRLKVGLRARDAAGLEAAFKTLDLCLTHCLYLEAIAEYLGRGGRSRGSFLVPDPGGRKPVPGLDDSWRFSLARETDFPSGRVLEVRLDERGKPVKTWVETRPVPRAAEWFETIWHDFRRDRIVREEGDHGP
jgi:succinate dehydrogenase/fumarate reductase flavoprotein subunit